MKVVFFGTPEFAIPSLEALKRAGQDIALVVTREPKPAGRKNQLRKSPVHEYAERYSLPVATPRRLSEITDQLARLDFDFGIVVAYGLLVPKSVLDLARFDFLNLHPSILPRWRGAAPIQRTIMAGDRETAATIMLMDEGLDTGRLLISERTNTGLKTATELHDELAQTGARLMVETVETIVKLQPWKPISYSAIQSEEGVCYAAKIDKSETRIDWNRSPIEVRQHILALADTPGAWCDHKGERIKILYAQECESPENQLEMKGPPGLVLDDRLRIACRTGSIRVLRLQRAGKPAMLASTFLHGNSIKDGAQL